MIKIRRLLVGTIVLTASFALAQTPSEPPTLLAPGGCPPGAVCRMGMGPAPYSAESPGANWGYTSAAPLEDIWSAAQQLKLTSDQQTQLDSSLKAQKNERAALDKALQDAQAALARSLANGQTFLDAEIESWASARAKVEECELKSWAMLYAISSPDQQKQLLSMPTPLSLATASHRLLQVRHAF